MIKLTPTDQVRLTASGTITMPDADHITAASRAWQAALRKARGAMDELRVAEQAYIAAVESVRRTQGRKRRMPKLEPYAVPWTRHA